MIIIIRLYFKRPLIVLRYFEVADFVIQDNLTMMNCSSRSIFLIRFILLMINVRKKTTENHKSEVCESCTVLLCVSTRLELSGPNTRVLNYQGPIS